MMFEFFSKQHINNDLWGQSAVYEDGTYKRDRNVLKKKYNAEVNLERKYLN